MSRKLAQAYCMQKHDAKRRNIQFELSFDEWMKVWEDSGHLLERGRKRGQYVMARFGDSGPYAVWNVKIIKTEENLREWERTPVDAARLHAADLGIMEGEASLAGIYQQLGNGVYRDIRHAGNRPHGRPLAKHGEDLNALFDGQLVHAANF